MEARVRQEVANYNNKLPERYNDLTEPTDSETILTQIKSDITDFEVPSKKYFDNRSSLVIITDKARIYIKQWHIVFACINNIEAEILIVRTNHRLPKPRL